MPQTIGTAKGFGHLPRPLVTEQEIDRIEAMGLVPCYAAGDTLRLTTHIFKVDVHWEPLCGKPEVRCGPVAGDSDLAKFCPECWKEFGVLSTAERHDQPIETVEGFILDVHWDQESGRMVLWAEKEDSGNHQVYHLEEQHAVNLVYRLSTLLLDILDGALKETEGQHEETNTL